ncbi:hypothetical protein EBS40_09070, partial [bacterium]|nr:hypothetical protein [bacterium]
CIILLLIVVFCLLFLTQRSTRQREPKTVIAVIASNGEHYERMKDIWIRNVQGACNTNIHVYFLYGNGNGITPIDKSCNMYDFRVPCEESPKNILYKTLYFYNWLTRFSNINPDIVIRSNLSTVFHLDHLQKSLLPLTQYHNLFAGTFVHGFLGSDTWFSGTNFTLSIPAIKLLLEHSQRLLKSDLNDDVVISTFIFKNFAEDFYFCNFPRIDFHDTTLFQYCNITDYDKVFCFRFKSSDRMTDARNMHRFIDSSLDPTSLFDESNTYELTGNEESAMNVFTLVR